MSAGRGRGRGIVKKQFFGNDAPGHGNGAQQAPRPQSALTKSPDVITPSINTDATVTDVTTCMNNLGIDAQKDDLEKLTSVTASFATNSESLKQVVTLIYKRSLSDPDFCESMAKAVSKLWLMEVGGTAFRSILLTLMQSDFKIKDELRTTSEDRFIAYLSFLCQMFLHVRMEAGEPYKVLINPVVQCLHMLIQDGSDLEVESCTLQLQQVGPSLELAKADALEALFNGIRRRIVSHKTSHRARLLLLGLLETKMNQWRPLSPSIMLFYADLTEDEPANSWSHLLA